MSAPSPWVEAFAPATVSNLGPGYDCLGMALDLPGDHVLARRCDRPGVHIVDIDGDHGKLPTEASRNTAGVAATQLVDRYASGAGVELRLRKGLPLGSGLGSSGASACAAVVAVERALGLQVGKDALVEACREGERIACGAAHPDNVAPCIYGGIVLIAALDPLRVVSLPTPSPCHVVVYTPDHEVPTAKARAALPDTVPLGAVSENSARLAQLVHGLHQNDLMMVGEAMVDRLVEPVRAELIPGYRDAKAACLEAGALACSISGAGPTTFALTDDPQRATALLQIFDDTYRMAGVRGKGRVATISEGARIVSPPLH
jgi:homoserine kinase